MYRKQEKARLLKFMESMENFNSSFDKKFRAGLPSCWNKQGSLLSWEQYEIFLVEEKSEINASHDKTKILKGDTIMNYLLGDFQLLWLVKNLFTDKPTYTKVTNLKMAFNIVLQCPIPDLTLWKKCQSLISPMNVRVVQPRASSSEPKFQIV